MSEVSAGEQPQAASSARWDIALAGLAGVLALAIYIRSLAPGLLWGDSAEFQFATWLGGFVHPTGYPLYLLLGALWSHILPLGDPAWRMNLFSALWGGVATGLLYLLVARVLRLLGGSRGAARVTAFGAALVFMFSPTFWSQAVIAEVYTLHAVFVSAILLVLVAWAERVWRGDDASAARHFYVMALLFGLGLAHHRSTLLLAPAAMIFWGLVGRNRWRALLSRVHLIPVLGAVTLPLLLYLLIPLRAPHVPYYRLVLGGSQTLPLYESTLAGFLAHVSGSVFAGSLTASQIAARAGDLVARFVSEFSRNGVILGGIGVVFLVARMVVRRDGRAGAVFALTGVAFLTQIVFNQFYAIGDIFVFYIPVYLIWTLWLGAGAWALTVGVSWVAGRARWSALLGAAAAVAVLLALAFQSASVQWPRVQRASDTSARDAWEMLLAADLPQGAVLVSNDRDEMVPLWYLQYVEGRRTDLTGLFPLIQPGADWANVGQVGERALGAGRPVYLIKPMAGLETKFQLATVPESRSGLLGPLVQVLGLAGAAEPQRPTDVVFGDVLRLAGYDLAPPTRVGGATVEVALYWDVLQPPRADWTTFVQIINGDGAKVGQSDHRAGGVYYPTGLWRAGERLRDVHHLTLEAEPGSGPFALVVGLYIIEGETLRHLGNPAQVGELLAQ